MDPRLRGQPHRALATPARPLTRAGSGACVAGRDDTDFNGVPDWFSTFKDGILIQGDVRPNDSRVVTRRTFFTRGILREEWVDEDADGKFDYRIEFDPFEKPSEHLPMAAPK